jgi:cytochrome c oxidase subunit 2
MVGGGSPSALVLQSLAWGFTVICSAVVIIIAVLIWIAIRRSRADAVGSDISEVVRKGDGLALIWWGLGLSVPVLVGMALWNFLTTRLLADSPRAPAMTVAVTAHQWWWDIHYRAGGLDIASANELVIPTGTPIRLQLASSDVIHDFWVPKLGPKMDMIPGRTNQTWIEADRPGTYRGQCAEYCGLEHARMAFTVRAVSPAVFGAWLDHQAQGANGTHAPFDNAAPPAETTTAPSDAATPSQATEVPMPPQTTQELFEARCGVCHTVRGTSAGGIAGPDLTHFGARGTIAAGWEPNTPANLDAWLVNPQAVKPGVDMPRVQLTTSERGRLVAWLEGLT